MWECKYAKEPVDYRLFWLRFKKIIWVLPLAIIIGAVFVVLCHYADKMISNGGRTYETTSVFYLDFAEKEDGSEYEFLNYYTWGELIHSDYFMDSLFSALGGKYSKDELMGAVSANIESDVRYLYVRVTTNSKEESLEIAKAFEPIVISFAGEQKEFNEIKLSDKGDTYRDSTKLRIANAAGLGAVLGLFIALVVILLMYTLDTAIYIPATLERRYGIKTLGASCMSEYKLNCEVLLENAGTIAYVSVDGDSDVPEFAGKKVKSITGVLDSKDAIDEVKNCDALVLGVRAGKKNDKILERYLDEFNRLGICVSASVLTKENEELIKAYYRA